MTSTVYILTWILALTQPFQPTPGEARDPPNPWNDPEAEGSRNIGASSAYAHAINPARVPPHVTNDESFNNLLPVTPPESPSADSKLDGPPNVVEGDTTLLANPPGEFLSTEGPLREILTNAPPTDKGQSPAESPPLPDSSANSSGEIPTPVYPKDNGKAGGKWAHFVREPNSGLIPEIPVSKPESPALSAISPASPPPTANLAPGGIPDSLYPPEEGQVQGKWSNFARKPSLASVPNPMSTPKPVANEELSSSDIPTGNYPPGEDKVDGKWSQFQHPSSQIPVRELVKTPLTPIPASPVPSPTDSILFTNSLITEPPPGPPAVQLPAGYYPPHTDAKVDGKWSHFERDPSSSGPGTVPKPVVVIPPTTQPLTSPDLNPIPPSNIPVIGPPQTPPTEQLHPEDIPEEPEQIPLDRKWTHPDPKPTQPAEMAQSIPSYPGGRDQGDKSDGKWSKFERHSRPKPAETTAGTPQSLSSYPGGTDQGDGGKWSKFERHSRPKPTETTAGAPQTLPSYPGRDEGDGVKSSGKWSKFERHSRPKPAETVAGTPQPLPSYSGAGKSEGKWLNFGRRPAPKPTQITPQRLPIPPPGGESPLKGKSKPLQSTAGMALLRDEVPGENWTSPRHPSESDAVHISPSEEPLTHEKISPFASSGRRWSRFKQGNFAFPTPPSAAIFAPALSGTPMVENRVKNIIDTHRPDFFYRRFPLWTPAPSTEKPHKEEDCVEGEQNEGPCKEYKHRVNMEEMSKLRNNVTREFNRNFRKALRMYNRLVRNMTKNVTTEMKHFNGHAENNAFLPWDKYVYRLPNIVYEQMWEKLTQGIQNTNNYFNNFTSSSSQALEDRMHKWDWYYVNSSRAPRRSYKEYEIPKNFHGMGDILTNSLDLLWAFWRS